MISLSSNAINNLIQYSLGDGNDIIYGFKSHSTLSIGGGSYSTQVSDLDIIITVGDGKITLVDAANLSSLNIVGTKSTVQPTLLTATDKTKSPVTVASAIKTIDASSRTSGIKITDNALANSIIGGSGADTLWGDDGNDIFIYSAGNDVIADYATGDKISLGAAISKASISGSKLVRNWELGTGD